MTSKPRTGRPTLYREAYPEQARKLCLLGFTDMELAAFFGVADTTIDLWKKTHLEFAEALIAGKSVADAEVAAKFYQRALGYSHPAVKIFLPQGAISPTVVDYVEYYPPDTAAASLWLRNRQPKKWRDRQEVTGPDGGAMVTEVVYRWAEADPETPPKKP